MQLLISLDASVVRVLEDGSKVLAAKYGGAYFVSPGSAEIFIMAH